MNLSIFFFMIHGATLYTLYLNYRQSKRDAMEVKRKLYLRTILLLLTNYTIPRYTMGEDLFVNGEKYLVKHWASRLSVRNNVTKKTKERKDRKRVTSGWTDILGRGRDSFLSMYYIMLTLHNLINSLNVVSTNSFSWASYFTSLTTWVQTSWDGSNLTNKQIKSKSIISSSLLSRIRLFSFEYTN